MADRSVYSTYPDTLTTSNDGQGITIETSFYVVGVSGWSIKGVKLWVPTGSAMIGQSVTLKAWVPGVESAGLAGTAQGSGTITAVAGWNQVTFTPVAVTAGVKFGVSYTSAGPYFAGTNPTLETRAADGSALYESEQNSGGSYVPQFRGAYRYASGSGAKFELRSGLDVIMDDGTTSSTTGTISGSTPKITGSVAGASLNPGTVAASVPKVTGSISGTVASTITGTLSAPVPKVTGSAPGVVLTAGSVAGAVPAVTASIVGSVTVTGTLSGQLPKVTGSISSGLSIAQENALTAGVAGRGFWFDYGADEILGFARSTYYTPGQTARFSVDYASSFTVQVWRLGWYGSDGARKVAEFAGTTAATQPAPATIANSNGAVTCSAWAENVTWDIPADSTPGWYWLFMRNAGGTQFGGILFCVSDINARKPILVVASEATWGAAYNGYGGNNVYGASLGIGSITARALCSSYDKPVISRSNVPQTHFFNGELATLRFLERFGFEVGYTTCEQINNDPTVMDGRSLVVFSGHNEYVSQRMRDKTEAIIAAGTNVANFGGNDFFWRVAYAGTTFPAGSTDTSTGRVMWCRKDTMTGPSGSGHTAGAPFTTQADWTGTWQDTRYTNRQPSNQLLGDRFIANGIRADEVKVPFAMKGLPIWRNAAAVQALTTGQTWSAGVGTAGMEWDMPDGSLPSVSLSASTVDLTGNSSDANGENYNLDGTYTHAFQMVRNGSAHIFNGNTTQWGWALDDLHLRGTAIATATARQATLNVLYDLGVVGVTALITGASLVEPTPVDIDTAYGLPSSVTGAVNGQLPKVTGSASGVIVTAGTVSAALPKVTGSISGASLTTGTTAGTTPAVTGSIAGNVITAGSVAGALPAVTGGIVDTITGAVSGSLPRLTGTVTGTSVVTGAITATLPSVTGQITGDGLIVGSVSGQLPKVAGSVPGAVVITGTVSGTTPAVTGSVSGVITGPTTGAIAGALPAVTGSVTGVAVVVGAVSGQLPSVTGGIAGGVIITGLISAALPRVTGGTQPPITDYTITAGTPILGSGITAGRGIW